MASKTLGLFEKVKCHGYLEKVWDGRYIQRYPEKGEIDSCEYVFGVIDGKEVVKPVENYDGSEEFLKTYYEEKKKDFDGFIVGTKKIVVTGWLIVDTYTDFRGCEHIKISKEPEKVVDCYIVYFANNRKRFVPMNRVCFLEE